MSRFSTLECSHNEYVDSSENINTKEKTSRDVKVLKEFLLHKNEKREIHNIQQEELDDYLAEFVRSVKRNDGKDCEPSSLRAFVSSFERHLKRKNYPASISYLAVIHQSHLLTQSG